MVLLLSGVPFPLSLQLVNFLVFCILAHPIYLSYVAYSLHFLSCVSDFLFSSRNPIYPACLWYMFYLR